MFEELLNNDENTSPTHHDKILIGKVREYNLTEVQENVEKLINSYSSQNNNTLVKQMKETTAIKMAPKPVKPATMSASANGGRRGF